MWHYRYIMHVQAPVGLLDPLFHHVHPYACMYIILFIPIHMYMYMYH